jgi:hypothetical protein
MRDGIIITALRSWSWGVSLSSLPIVPYTLLQLRPDISQESCYSVELNRSSECYIIYICCFIFGRSDAKPLGQLTACSVYCWVLLFLSKQFFLSYMVSLHKEHISWANAEKRFLKHRKCCETIRGERVNMKNGSEILVIFHSSCY